MKRRPGGVVYDFKDFISVVGSSNSKKVKEVGAQEWRNQVLKVWPLRSQRKEDSQTGSRTQSSSCHGSRSMFAKRSHEEEAFSELDFLQNKFQIKIPTTLRPQDKGIDEARKSDILKKLGPLIPPTRTLFWSSLPVSSTEQ